MRSWSVVGRYPIYKDGVVVKVDVTLASTSGLYATFSESVAGDHVGTSDDELVNLALEAFFKSEFADKAMAESVQKIDELEETTKEAKAFMENAADEFEAIKTRQDTAEKERNDRFKALEADMQAKIDDAVAELTVMFSGFAGQFEEAEAVEDTPKDTTPHDVEVEIEE